MKYAILALVVVAVLAFVVSAHMGESSDFNVSRGLQASGEMYEMMEQMPEMMEHCEKMMGGDMERMMSGMMGGNMARR